MEHSRTHRDELIALLVTAGVPIGDIAAEVELSGARCRMISRGFWIDKEPPSAAKTAERIAEIRHLRFVASDPTQQALALRRKLAQP